MIGAVKWYNARISLSRCGTRQWMGMLSRVAGVLAMLPFMSRSLLVQLLSVYLLFAVVVLLGGVGVNAIVERQLRNDVEASDQALAQEIALQTSLQLRGAENSVDALGKLVLQTDTPDAIANIFQAFQAARSDVDQVYWLDPFGAFIVSWSPCPFGLVAGFSPANSLPPAHD